MPSQARPDLGEPLALELFAPCDSSPHVNMRFTARFLNMATTTLSSGKIVRGKASNYQILERLQKDRDVWAAM